MAKNSQLPPVPVQSNIAGDEKVNDNWLQWFLRLRFLNSNENFQTIDNTSSPVALDAEYVALKATTANITITLEAPTIENRWKTIEMTDRSAPYSATLALTNIVGGTASTSANFDAANETLVLLSKNGKWLVMKEYNVTLS